LCSVEARLAALVGLIAGAIGHHSTEALVRAPMWITIATAAVFAAALMKSRSGNDRSKSDHDKRSLSAALVIGVVAGYTLPGSAPASWQPVITHAAVHSVRNDMFEALDALDTRPATLLGKRISVTGVWHPSDLDSLATVSQRVMACCAADAVDVGFDVVPVHTIVVPVGAHVLVAGTVTEMLRQGETRYVLRDARVKLASEGSSGAR
jgi:uncharacterized membrane protein YcgQ (UPF0703/DUF1980 family)